MMAPPGLDTLPAEILFHIFSYTAPYSVHSFPVYDFNSNESHLRRELDHRLLCIAATSKHLCNLVEEYCCSLLRIHNIKIPKAPKNGVFVCRKKWFSWIQGHCALCFKASKRKAIFDSGMACCKNCDNKYFPKMTQTAAIRKHGLSKLDLFTPSVLHPDLPPLTLGSYTVMGGEALMISEPSVLKRKAYIRSLLDPEVRDDEAYLRRRAAAHDRIIPKMFLHLEVGDCQVRWVRVCPSFAGVPIGETTTHQFLYARQNLFKQWAAMGMHGHEELWNKAIKLWTDSLDETTEGDFDDKYLYRKRLSF